jgi:hypothetical protein
MDNIRWNLVRLFMRTLLFCLEFVQAVVTLLQSSDFEVLPFQNINNLGSIWLCLTPKKPQCDGDLCGICGGQSDISTAVSPNTSGLLLTGWQNREEWGGWRGERTASMADRTCAHRVLVEKHERKRLLRRPRHRWKGNMKMQLERVGWEDVDWIDLAQDRDKWRALVSAVMNIRVPYNVGNFLTGWGPIGFSGGTLHHG